MAALASILVVTTLVTSWGKGRTAKTVLLVAFLSAGILLIVWIGALEPTLSRFETLEHEYAVTGQGRWAIWQDTLRLISRHPWFGTGFGTLGEAYRSVQTSYPNKFVQHSHNDYLEIISGLRLIGEVLMFGSFFYLLVGTIKSFPEERGSS